jgi:hypothetical protein
MTGAKRESQEAEEVSKEGTERVFKYADLVEKLATLASAC